MERGSWSEISSDSGIWKKMLIGGVCIMTVLPIPVALGAVHTDLESEASKIKEKTRAGIFPEMYQPGTLLGRGLAPSFMFALAIMLFCLPTVVILMSAVQTYTWLNSEHGMNILSFLITAVFGIIALVAQFICALLFPLSLAQYARGMNLKPALHPLANLGHIYEMGAPYWLRGAGWWLFLIGYTVLYVVGPVWWINIPLQLLLAVVGFVSLIISSRFALAHVSEDNL